MVKTVIIRPAMSAQEAKALEGKFIDDGHYDTLIEEDADVYWDDNGTQRLLFHFRKGVIPDSMLKEAIGSFKKAALNASSIRGVAAGEVDVKKISGNAVSPVSPGKYRSKIIYRDGTVSNYYKSNNVNSLIAGYFDKPKLMEKKEVIKSGRPPCRTTAFTEKNKQKWESALPLIQLMDSYYQRLEPDVHKSQLRLANSTRQFSIAETAFSTLTVNYNWRTACHVDSGDYKGGYSVIFVAQEGNYLGGYLVYPRFRIAVNVRHGDFLLKDPHQQHANTSLMPLSEDWTRLSFVLYYREGLLKCRDMVGGSYR